MPSGSYAERIRTARPNLSKSFQRLADYILDSYVQAALLTASELGHQVGVDSATVVRFAQAIGYSGFPELQDEVKARVLQELMLRPRESREADSLPALADRTFKELGDAIERTRRLMDTAPLEELIRSLGDAKRVLVVADANAQFIIDELLRHLQAVGILGLRVLAEEGVLSRNLALAGDNDVLLAIDLMNENPLVSAAMTQAKSAGLRGAAIVGSASYDAARRADIVLEVQRQDKDDGASVMLGALVHAIGSALRWRYAAQYKENLAKAEKVLRKLTSARQVR